MIKWFKNLAWIVQIRWIIYTSKTRRKNYGWDDEVPPPPSV